MRRNPGDRHGLASILDAFMFLLAMFALGSFLIVSASDDNEGENDSEWQTLVERVHVVLASVTLRLPVSLEPEIEAPCVELTALIQPDEGGQRMALPGWAQPQVCDIIVGLLGHGWAFKWTASILGVSCVLASSEAMGDRDQTFSSTLQMADGDGQGCALRLMIWFT